MKPRGWHKYKARAERYDGIYFKSQKELARYKELRILEKAGRITDLVVHPKFSIDWPCRCTIAATPNPIIVDIDAHICKVELDFQYRDKVRGVIYEDTKGFDLALSKLKRKLVEAAYGIDVEVL